MTCSARPAASLSPTTASASFHAELATARGQLVEVEPRRLPLRLHPRAWCTQAEIAPSLLVLSPTHVSAELREARTRTSFGFLAFRLALGGWEVRLVEPRWGWGWQRALRACLPRDGRPAQHLLAALLADDAWVRANQLSVDLRLRTAVPGAPLPWAGTVAAEVRHRARLLAALRHPDATVMRLAWELGFEIDCPPAELVGLAAAAAVP